MRSGGKRTRSSAKIVVHGRFFVSLNTRTRFSKHHPFTTATLLLATNAASNSKPTTGETQY
jgi:hypothetical protein